MLRLYEYCSSCIHVCIVLQVSQPQSSPGYSPGLEAGSNFRNFEARPVRTGSRASGKHVQVARK